MVLQFFYVFHFTFFYGFVSSWVSSHSQLTSHVRIPLSFVCAPSAISYGGAEQESLPLPILEEMLGAHMQVYTLYIQITE